MDLTRHSQLSLKLTNEFDSLLRSQASSLFYQCVPYHNLLKEHLDCESKYFMWHDKGLLMAAFPFLIKRSEKFGTVFNSLPYYGSNGGFVFHKDMTEEGRKIVRNQFLEAAEEEYLHEKTVLSTIISNPLEPEDKSWFESNLKFDKTDSRIGQITSLPEYSGAIEQDLLLRFSNPRPRNIRRAIKAGIQVEIRHDLDALRFLFDVHKDNIEAIGGKPKKYSFFESIPKFFSKEQYSVYVATIEGKPIGALLLFYFNKTIEYFTPATIHDYRNDQPSALLIFEAMKEGSKRGFSKWNWGGTWRSQTGVYDFKKRWGAQDYDYRYFTRVLDERVLVHSVNELSLEFPNFYLYPY